MSEPVDFFTVALTRRDEAWQRVQAWKMAHYSPISEIGLARANFDLMLAERDVQLAVSLGLELGA